MEKIIDVESLVLEVTKRCNQNCDHCLRGCARNVDMAKETVDKVLDNVRHISSIVFTGGEPTLNLPIIEYFFEEVKRREIGVGYFWLATNGLDYEKELQLINILLKNYYLMEEGEYCGVALSEDDFHEPIINSPLKLLSFYDHGKEHDNGEQDWLLSRGNAEEYGLGCINRNIKQNFTEVNCEYIVAPASDGSTHIVEGIPRIELLYVDALGRLYADCDLSYKDQDEMPLGSVDTLYEDIEKDLIATSVKELASA